ncbi:hypothetical protein FACS1894102_7510 [Spirochaetia bacterium]|nr:hypothetical protein FACS1894102_7510 [Spirochaetia bacterium]
MCINLIIQTKKCAPLFHTRLSGYDVQETRRQVREETWQEAWQEAEQKASQKEKAIADYLRTQGISDELIKNAMSVQPK